MFPAVTEGTGGWKYLARWIIARKSEPLFPELGARGYNNEINSEQIVHSAHFSVSGCFSCGWLADRPDGAASFQLTAAQIVAPGKRRSAKTQAPAQVQNQRLIPMNPSRPSSIVNEVRVVFTVTDRHCYIKDLTNNDFRVIDDIQKPANCAASAARPICRCKWGC